MASYEYTMTCSLLIDTVFVFFCYEQYCSEYLGICVLWCTYAKASST